MQLVNLKPQAPSEPVAGLVQDVVFVSKGQALAPSAGPSAQPLC